MDTVHCIGCDDNIFNGHNDFGVKECWALKDIILAPRLHVGKTMYLPKCYFIKKDYKEAIDNVKDST